jgi:hypothetical protein
MHCPVVGPGPRQKEEKVGANITADLRAQALFQPFERITSMLKSSPTS